MTRYALLAMVAVGLVGCANMTPAQKKWAGFGAGVLVVGAIAAHKADNGDNSMSGDGTIGAIGSPPRCTVQPDGSCR